MSLQFLVVLTRSIIIDIFIVDNVRVYMICFNLQKKRLKELRHRSCILKKSAKLFKIVIFNPFQSSQSSAILVPFCFRITPLVFFFLSKPLFFKVYQHFNRILGHRRNYSKYRDVAPLKSQLQFSKILYLNPSFHQFTDSTIDWQIKPFSQPLKYKYISCNYIQISRKYVLFFLHTFQICPLCSSQLAACFSNYFFFLRGFIRYYDQSTCQKYLKQGYLVPKFDKIFLVSNSRII